MDTRGYIAKLKELGLVVKIEDVVNPDIEAGAIMRLANERGAPAQLFTNVQGAMPGSTLFGGPFATYERIALALGLPQDTSYHELVDSFAEKLGKRIPPTIVTKAPCQQNVDIGDKVDLFKFPIPKLHPSDGGKYIGTLDICVTKDPDSQWQNWGTYRGMVHDKKSTGIYFSPVNHGGTIMRRYHARGQTMEFAMVFGGHPVYTLLSSCGVPYGVSEVDVAGGFIGRSVDLVKCKTVDLYVPADAEVVLEGTVAPGDEKDEGPFGEYPGYVSGGVFPRPVFRISAITYRDNPVLPSTCLGIPKDDALVWGVSIAASIKQALKARGVPITGICAVAESAMHMITVSTATPSAGLPQLIASIVWADRNGGSFPYVVVCDDDVDPANMDEVVHAISTKCHPGKDIHVWNGAPACSLTPYIPREHSQMRYGGSNVLLDCTWPMLWPQDERPERLGFGNAYPEDVRRKVLANAKRWGIE